jgi:hypothetical protein
MHSFVFTDEALARHAGRFVWLSVDTEREQNAPFLERYPVEAWPSLYVIDPRTGQVALRWLGSATVPQLLKLLEDGERAIRGDLQGADAALARADALYGERKHALAAEEYLGALALAPADWNRRERAVESALFAILGAGDPTRCVKEGLRRVPALGRGPSRANAASLGLSCALELAQDHPDRAEAVSTLGALVEDALSGPALPLAADDLSGFYDLLVAARGAVGDDEGKRLWAGRWAEFLEAHARAARTAEQRTVFDSHRLSAYLALGEPERALPMLLESEAALPADYNPPARLALVYRLLGRLDEALAASDRALAKVYGPRRIRVLLVRADIHLARGAPAQARRTLEGALVVYRALPSAQQHPRQLAAIERQLESLPE